MDNNDNNQHFAELHYPRFQNRLFPRTHGTSEPVITLTRGKKNFQPLPRKLQAQREAAGDPRFIFLRPFFPSAVPKSRKRSLAEEEFYRASRRRDARTYRSFSFSQCRAWVIASVQQQNCRDGFLWRLVEVGLDSRDFRDGLKLNW